MKAFRCIRWLVLLGSCLCAGLVQAGDTSARAPNVILILADDLGWSDLPAYGNRYHETPHIDRLAAEGTRFTNFHVSPNCAPTRASLLTGQYSTRTGVYTVGTLARGNPRERAMRVPKNRVHLPLGVTTLADVMRQRGYRTGMYGKWHLGDKGRFQPTARGFDEAIITGPAHFRFSTRPHVKVPGTVSNTEFVTAQSLAFIERHQAQPFFLYVPLFALHEPLKSHREQVRRFQGKPRTSAFDTPRYAAMVSDIDDAVGAILAKLDALGLAGNTLVLLASDNGAVGRFDDEDEVPDGSTRNAPWRAGKGSLYEGGLRVPLLARWPGVVPAQRVNDQLLAHIDIMPTLMAVAGAAPDSVRPLDGLDFQPVLRGEVETLRRKPLYWHFPGYLEGGKGADWRLTPSAALLANQWKLLEWYEDGRVELYHLGKDPGEKHNLAEALPEKKTELLALLHEWQARTKADMPVRKRGVWERFVDYFSR